LAGIQVSLTLQVSLINSFYHTSKVKVFVVGEGKGNPIRGREQENSRRQMAFLC
jgi:hypothetical protein